MDSRFQRQASPDIQKTFKDPNASNQRFLLSTRCSDDCVLRFRTSEDEAIDKTLEELREAPIGFDLGGGRVFIDTAGFQPDPEYTPSPFDGLCVQIRNATMISYSWLFLPILVFGSIIFLYSALVFWKRAIWNVCFMMALVCWGLAYARTTLLLLIDLTSFPAFNAFYLAPAYFMLVSGAVLSIAAWIQLSQSSRRAPQDAALNDRKV